jgi:glutamine amidotransferase
MCRFVLYLGKPLTLDMLTTRPKHSLIHQSYKARERKEPLNGDGFGLAWYARGLSEEPALYRSTSPAWNDPNLRELARVTRSHCVLAHVRAATPPLPVVQLNCHPFGAGKLAFMHNGYIPSFSRVRRTLLRELSDEAFAMVKGSTDSEHILGLLHDRLAKDGVPSSAGDLADSLLATLQHVDELVKGLGITRAPHLNIAVSDGERAVVSRYCAADPDTADSLYVHHGKAYVCEDGTCRMVEPDGEGAVIVASEPLSSDPGWELVPVNHLVVIESDLSVSFRKAV